VLEVNTQHQFTNRLRTQLQHILINIPGLAHLIELIEYVERVFDSRLHRRRVVTHSLGAQCRWEELVCSAPLRSIRITEEDTCFLVLDGI
jgi:hypothetical protein